MMVMAQTFNINIKSSSIRSTLVIFQFWRAIEDFKETFAPGLLDLDDKYFGGKQEPVSVQELLLEKKFFATCIVAE